MSADIENLFTLTRSGRRLYFTQPEKHKFHIPDIAWHLSLICRYGGACAFHYSVAQHSVLMAEVAYAMTGDATIALDCLFHDAAEAYIGDMKKPIKVQLPKFEEIEKRIDRALRDRLIQFKVPVPYRQTAVCKELDKRMFLTEWPVLMGQEDCGGWYGDLTPLQSVTIEPWSPQQSYETFLEMVRRLSTEANNIYGDITR